MSAIGLLARSMTRRRVAVTVGLALAIGLPLGLAGAGLQAWRRADNAVERHDDRATWYDVSVSACPPGVDARSLPFDEIGPTCLTPELTQRFADEVLRTMPEVVDISAAGAHLVAIDDPTSPNGWGWPILTLDGSHFAPMMERQILVAGRPLDDDRPDEVMIGEKAAQRAGIEVGDVLTLRSWSYEDTDAATGGAHPTTEPFTSTVVGIVRTDDDVSAPDLGPDFAFLSNYLYGGRAWSAAHARDIAGYNTSNIVRLARGPAAVAAFTDAMNASPGGWTVDVQAMDSAGQAAIDRVISVERQAVLIVTIITIVATAALGGLMLTRQLRRELPNRVALDAIGLRHRDLAAAAGLRMLTIMPIAVLVAIAATISLSPFTPLGKARDLEYSHPFRVDPVALGVITLVAVVLGAAAASLAAAPPRRSTPRRVSRIERSRRALPTVPRLGVQMAQATAQPSTVLVVALAIVAAAAGATVVSSFDELVAHPTRYGAWYDVAVGEYSLQASYERDAAALRRNPAIRSAAGVLDGSDSLVIEGQTVAWMAFVPVVGEPRPVVRDGRAPLTADEVAIGKGLAESLGVAIGDDVHWANSDGTVDGTLRIVGEVVYSNPVTSSTDPGRSVLVTPAFTDVLNQCSGCETPQSIAIELDPTTDRAAALESVRSISPGSMRPVTPPTDVANLARLRFVPPLIAGIIGALALAVLIHGLLVLVRRHRLDLAVLSALGMTKRQRRTVALVGGSAISTAGVLLGIPIGIIVGHLLWRAIANHLFLVPFPSSAWTTTAIVAVMTVVLGAAVAWLAARRPTARRASQLLRTE